MFRIMKYLSKAEIGQMLIALVSIVGQIWFDLELPDYMSDITTLVETPGSAMADIWTAGGKMLLISLGSVCCAIITGYIAARVASSFGQRLRSLEFRKVESFGPAEMSKFSTASLITRSTNDITDNINLGARENLTGLRVVRAYNAEDYQESKFTKANKDLTDTQLFTNRTMAIMMPLMNTVMNGLMLAVYWIGAYLIEAAELTDKLTVFSNMVVFSSYSVQVIMSFLLMSMVFVLWPRADVSAQRVMEVLNTEPIVKNGTKRAADIAKTGQTGTVEFRNVSFTYPDSREAMLQDINFKAEKGQTVAFIGSTGSGKSSLINLVPRFYDVSAGQVLVDGVDVRDYDMVALRDKIGYVPQRSVLFKGTVAGNISYGDKPGENDAVELADTSTSAGRKREALQLATDAANDGKLTDEQMSRVKAAADVAQASEFVNRMDGGFDSPIAQGGSNVSGGQKQRLSIARAVYRHPEILIFDDSFSALDFKTDRAVRDALAEEAKDSTKLIVAQRIGTIMNADRIVVLDEGKVVGQGTHKELLENCEVYRQIAESQLSESELTA